MNEELNSSAQAPVEEVVIEPSLPEEAPAETASSGEIEEVARALGWRGREEWAGDQSQWVDAKQYVLNERAVTNHLKEETKRLRSDISSMRSALDAFVGGQVKKQGAEIEAQIEDLRAQWRESVLAGDIEEVEALNRKIESMSAERAQTTAAQPPASPHEILESSVISEWNAKNPWIFDDSSGDESLKAMQETAKSTWKRARDAGDSPIDAVIKVNEAVRSYRRAQQGQQRHSPDVIQGKGYAAVPRSGYVVNESEIPIDARKVADTFERRGVIGPNGAYKSRSEYFKELFKTNALERV